MTQGIGYQNSPNTPPVISHFLHPQHPLTLKTGGSYTCNGCQRPTPGGGTRYCCRACNFDLDWACAMSNPSSWSTVPGMITQHFLHPQHLLMLQDGCGYRCNGCGHISPGGIRYHCSACNFDFDCTCAASPHSHHHLHSPAPPTMPGPSPSMPVGYTTIPGYAGANIYPPYPNQGSSGNAAGGGYRRGKRAALKAFVKDVAKATFLSFLLDDATDNTILYDAGDSTILDDADGCYF